MTQAISSQLDSLASLLDHPGWQLFREYVDREWGAGGERFESRLNQIADSDADDAKVLQHLRQIAVARREIRRLLRWPMEEVTRLRAAHTSEAQNTPRPALAEGLTPHSRRGRL